MGRNLKQMPDDPFVGHVSKDSIERLRKQAERNAGLIFASVYLLFLLAGVVALRSLVRSGIGSRRSGDGILCHRDLEPAANGRVGLQQGRRSPWRPPPSNIHTPKT